ncbi:MULTISPECIES: helix-turn-helix domain-containing protein [unclassified Marinovum]
MSTILPAALPRGQTEILCPSPGHAHRSVDRWDLLSLVTRLRKELGLADRDIMVLRAHLSVLPHGPLDPAGLNVSFMNLTEILERACGMDERRFRRGETRLEQAGLIRRRLSGNGRRFPERDKTGRIVSAYGIDLAPLLALHGELRALEARRFEQQRLLKQRKNSVSARLTTAIRTLIASGTPLPACVDALRDRLRKIVRRNAPTVQELDAIEADIHALEDMTETPSDGQTTAVCPDNSAVDDGQTVRHIESELKDINKTTQPSFNPQTFAQVWSETKTLKEFYPTSPEHERQAGETILEICGFMQLDRTQVITAIAAMGWENTVIVLDYLAEKVGAIRQPTAYLISMIAGFQRGNPIAGGRVGMRMNAG